VRRWALIDDDNTIDEAAKEIGLEWQLGCVGGYPLTHKHQLKADGSVETRRPAFAVSAYGGGPAGPRARPCQFPAGQDVHARAHACLARLLAHPQAGLSAAHSRGGSGLPAFPPHGPTQQPESPTHLLTPRTKRNRYVRFSMAAFSVVLSARNSYSAGPSRRRCPAISGSSRGVPDYLPAGGRSG
jgi:hypothetical protein